MWILKYTKKQFEDTKGLIRSANRRRTGNTMAQRKGTNNGRHNTTEKTKY